MDIEKKVMGDMRKLGCDCHQKIALAFHLYLYLIDELQTHDTEYCYNKDIDTIYILARPKKEDKLNIYIPMESSLDLDLDYVHKVQDNLCTVETGHTLQLAFIDASLCTTIYSFTKDMCPRQALEITKQRLIREQQHAYANNELFRRRYEYRDNALNGGRVDNYQYQLLDYVHKVQDNLCTVETGHTLQLAFIDASLCTTIYSFTKDMCPRQALEITKQRLIREQQHAYANNELFRRRYEYRDNALNGGRVDNYQYQL